MVKRRKTRSIKVRSVVIGSRTPVSVQSMTKVATTDIKRCVRQVKQLVNAGCDLVRIAVPTRNDTIAFKSIVEQVKVPLIADIHFSPDRAVEAIEAGAAKIRLNPGNIKAVRDIKRIIDCAKAHSAAIRIGVNEASIRDLKKNPVPLSRRVNVMLRELTRYVRLFEKYGFDRLVLSAKSTDTCRTIEVNQRISEIFDYPLHLGLTHAGLPEDAAVSSAVALGALLAQGIGDTIRVSMAGNPVAEARLARDILIPLGLTQRNEPELVVCPTCGRTSINVVRLAKTIKRGLKGVTVPVRIAVMGCVVNGPGEAADADLAVCAGKEKAFLYRQGRRIAVVEEDKLVGAIQAEIDLWE